MHVVEKLHECDYEEDGGEYEPTATAKSSTRNPKPDTRHPSPYTLCSPTASLDTLICAST